MSDVYDGASYLQDTRDRLVGELASHALLERDNANGLLPPSLSRDANEPQLVFVDEPNCVGCRSCAEVARNTFRMEDEFGAADAQVGVEEGDAHLLGWRNGAAAKGPTGHPAARTQQEQQQERQQQCERERLHRTRGLLARESIAD